MASQKLKLRDYQVEALKKIISVKNSLICIKVGKGKTLSAIFAARYLLNKGECHKAVFCGTKTSVNSFIRDFSKVGINVNLIEKEQDFIDFIKNDNKVAIIKHSMIKKIGSNKNSLDDIERYLSKDYKSIYLVVDEAHAFGNALGVGGIRSACGVNHECFCRCRFMFSRITLLTATPYSSCLSQLYGIIHLIHPKLWNTPKDFWNDHIETRDIKDWRTGRFIRPEKVRYKNLRQLRKKIDSFTYIYYPPVKLNFIEHKSFLKDYTKYDELCMGLITEEDIEKEKEKRNAKKGKLK